MSEIVIHGVPGSPYMRTVQATCEEKSAPYRISPITPGAQGADRYALHPFARIPVVDHGDFRLYETQAIGKYVDAAFGSPALTPSDPRAMARMNQIIGIVDWYFFPLVGRTLVFQRIIGPTLFGMTADESVCAAAVPDAERALAELNRLLGDKQFLAGEDVSHADLHVAPQLYYFAMTPEGARIMSQNAALDAWFARIMQRDSMKRTEPPGALKRVA
jgi:glutathione S-transferase